MATLARKLRTPSHELRERMEAAIERMVAFLDTLDSIDEDLEEDEGDDDCDREDGHDAEPEDYW